MRDEFAGLFVIIDCSQSLVFLLSIAQEMQSGSKDGVSLLVQQYRAQRSAVSSREGGGEGEGTTSSATYETNNDGNVCTNVDDGRCDDLYRTAERLIK